MTSPIVIYAKTDDMCVCGEVFDEHNPQTGACTRDGCPCIMFEQEGEV